MSTDRDIAVRAPYGPLPEGGSVRPITRWGSEVMHHANRAVTAYEEPLRALVADMVATMYAADGVGLAACQIGVDLAVFCFDCHDTSGERTVGVVCNPVAALPEGRERRLEEEDEGCLSLPGAYVPLARPDTAVVQGFGLDGSAVRFSGDGMLARCLQHETDHTNGTVFGDRLSTRWRKKLLKAHERTEGSYPADWPLSPADV
jgi:peptide deformylase